MTIRMRAGSTIPVGSDANCPTTCPTRQTLARLADRWTAQLLESLAPGPRRFGQLRASSAGISEKMLAQTLRGLERDGLVQRHALAGALPGVEYWLTELGTSLLEPLNAVRAWGRTHIDDIEQARQAYDKN